MGMEVVSPLHIHRRAFGCLCVFITLSFTLLTKEASAQQDLQIDTRAEAKIAVSDNVYLTEDDELSDLVVSVSTGINIRHKSTRMNVAFDYNIDYLKFNRDGKTDIRHSMFGTSSVEIIEDHLFWSGRAGVKQSFLDGTGSFSGSIANRTENRKTIQSYLGKLNWRDKITNIANVSASYEIGATLSPADNIADDTIATNFSDTFSHIVTVSADSGKLFHNFEWRLNLNDTRIKRSLNIPDYEDRKIGGEIWYRPNRFFAVSAGGGHHENNAQTDKLKLNGTYKELGVQLTPGPKLSLYGKRVFEPTNNKWEAQLRYILTTRVDVSANYSDEVSSNALVLQDNLKNLQFSDTYGIQDASGIPIDESNFGFTLSDTDFRRKQSAVTMKWRNMRNNAYIRVSKERRIFDNAGGDSKSRGVTVGWDRKINRLTNLKAAVSYRENSFIEIDRRDNYRTANIDWVKTLSRYYTAAVILTHSKRNSSQTGSNLKENSVTVYIRGQF